MYDRREIKRKAKQSLKKHYLIFVAVCLLAAVLGTSHTDTLSSMGLNMRQNVTESGGAPTDVVKSGNTSPSFGLINILGGTSISHMLKNSGVLGRSRGVFAMVVNMSSSGTFTLTLVSALTSISGSENVALALTILIGLLFMLFVWSFVINVFHVVSARIFLEGRIYETVPINKFLFLFRVKQWVRASLTMLLRTVYQGLWWFTIVGGFIKGYSYRMVPYIVAENPSIPSRQAITLSRRMMYGHKWECFKLECTLLGWRLLGLVTYGLVGLLFANPYEEAVFSEYYAHLRQLAKDINLKGSEYLNDVYLFEKAPKRRVSSAYDGVLGLLAEPDMEVEQRKGVLGFLANVFGVILVSDEQEMLYEENMAKKARIASVKDVLEGKAYPERLYPLAMQEKQLRIESLHYVRHYSVWSLVMLFFIFAFVGWLWEVSLHLISDGVFVNRGVLHGPWLPIYGTGGVMILILLNKFRSKPVVEFITAIVLCGCVEYFTAYYLELTHDGQKWWDYTGYFLNLHGRICAEGLLVFGVGGMAIVYLVAPLLDNIIKQINRKILIPVCIVLLIAYVGDQRYSSVHPNTGEGITDYTSMNTDHISQARL